MSKHDYTKYSKAVETEVEEIPVATADVEVDETVTDVSVSINESDVVVAEELAPVVKGRVTNCRKLNVRGDATLTSEVLCEILHNSEVEIDEEGSTDDFYKVTTVTGIEGFCKKEYIAISQ